MFQATWRAQPGPATLEPTGPRSRGRHPSLQVGGAGPHTTLVLLLLFYFLLFFYEGQGQQVVRNTVFLGIDLSSICLFSLSFLLEGTQVDRGDCWFLGHFFVIVSLLFIIFL